MYVRKSVLIGLVVLVLAAGGAALYFYKHTLMLAANPGIATQLQTADIVARVGKLVALPQGESPTVATVSDPAKLSNQPFFADAKAGDIVLIYTNARKAFLYDPAANIVVNVAPLNVGPQSSPATTTKGK